MGKVESFVEDPNTHDIIASGVTNYNQGSSFNEIANSKDSQLYEFNISKLSVVVL